MLVVRRSSEIRLKLVPFGTDPILGQAALFRCGPHRFIHKSTVQQVLGVIFQTAS